uniref:Putative nuclease harbi1-like protein n=1 Tax=Ixodes ricinus TaxID=34613 RepID=A0A6B0UBN3_IXORI
MSLKRRRLMLGVAPSVLLAKLADSDNTSSSDDDDEGRVYEAKFAELFDAPCTVPKVKAYVSIVRTYSGKEFRRNFRLARLTCYDLID